jgi:outer membrane biosynthesis protein TonB
VIDRGDISGFSLALIGHVGLVALILWLAPSAVSETLRPSNPPIEVTLTDEVALDATLPDPGEAEPAARLSPEEAPVEPESTPPPEPAKPEVAPKAAPPKPAPAPLAREKDKKPPEKAAPSASTRDNRAAQRPSPATRPSRPDNARQPRPTGRLDGMSFEATGNKPNNSTSEKPPAPIGPAVRNSLAAEVLRQIKPYWVPPSGADSDELRTSVRVSLDRSGSITGLGDCRQTGLTASNRPQAGLACENAKRAIRRAAPFKLPDQFYDAWKTIEPTLYEGL